MKTYAFNKVFALVAVVALLTGCQPKKESTTIDTRGNGVRGHNANLMGNANDIQLRGVIGRDSYEQEEFQKAVEGLLSTDLPISDYDPYTPNGTNNNKYIGFVSAAGQGSGVQFGGRVTLQGGSIRFASGPVNQQSIIKIQVYDQFSGSSSSSPLPAVILSNAQGMVQGNSASITFSDQYGSVRLEGQFDQHFFTGHVSYDNRVRAGGGTPAAGNLGGFKIPTCQFFICQ